VTLCVLDSSAALAWIMPGEGDAATDALLDGVTDAGAVVPGLWPLETANVLLAAERRGCITLAERRQALETLAELPIRVDPHTAARAWGDTLHLAASRDLTLYDASYLELALRSGLPLASLDRKLREAAAGCGVALLGKEGGAGTT
jgi:predicted nucleic acid-binding protein